jgi:hypothetical protein
MVGRMGIGATLDGPLTQVVLFAAVVLVFATGTSLLTVVEGTGEGRGAELSFVITGVTTGSAMPSERPINDFRNHDCFPVVERVATVSFEERL